MTWLWVLGILVALLVVLCRIRLGIRISFGYGAATVDITAGPLHFQIAPAKSPKKKKEKKKTTKTGGEQKAKQWKRPDISLAEIKEAMAILWPACKKALRRTRRGIRIKPLVLSIIIGGEQDPAAAAELYGAAHAAIWTAMPALEQWIVIPDPHVHLGLDFDTPRTKVQGTIGISIRIGTIVSVAFDLGIPVIKLLWRFWKQKKRQESTGKEKQNVSSSAA